MEEEDDAGGCSRPWLALSGDLRFWPELEGRGWECQEAAVKTQEDTVPPFGWGWQVDRGSLPVLLMAR